MTRGNGNIIPSSREQVIQSLDPGIVTEIMVKEGDMVEKDQILMKLETRAAPPFCVKAKPKSKTSKPLLPA